MMKYAVILALLVPLINGGAVAATRTQTADFVSPTAYNTMYSVMNNKMRTSLNPGTTPSVSNNPISAFTQTTNNETRRVVSRGVSSARSATTTGGTATTTIARAGTTGATATTATSARVGTTQATNAAATNSQSRRVVARSSRTENDAVYRATRNTPESNEESLPASRCLADYTTCMNGYCQREKTSYNRCYCSAQLAQIDAKYQPAIEELIQKILLLGSENTWTKEEMNEYWEQTIGQYVGDNSWTKLDEALDINWADTESRVRGQNAFLTGHEYCVQHLRGCYYMATNMRDAYRSEIARDCAAYEKSLQKIKNAAESIVENYDD